MSRLRLSAKAVGLDVCLSRLKAFPSSVRKDALRPAFKQFGQILSRDVKSQLPGKRQGATGQSKLSIGVKIGTGKDKEFLIVGPRRGFGLYITDGQKIKEARGRAASKAQRVLFRTADANGKLKILKKGVKYVNPTRYFHIFEGGSRKMSGRHPLQKALDRNKAQFTGILKTHTERAIAAYASNNS